jgi:carbamoyl-phosphate synthase large subunit
LRSAGIPSKTVFKVNEGRPNAVDLLKAGNLNLVIYTTTGSHSFPDEQTIRRNAVTYRTPCITTMSGARAAAEAIAFRRRDPRPRVWNLQELHARHPNISLEIEDSMPGDLNPVAREFAK